MNSEEKRFSGHQNVNDGASDTDDPSQPGTTSQHKVRLPAVPEKNSTCRESAIINDEATVLSREKLVAAREDAVHLREDAADLRERKIRQAEIEQAVSDDRRIMLQQVNERLVITTIEAQRLAEQLQATQTQLERAKAVAEKANLAKSAFLSSMSHELRTPLNAILGFAQLLEVSSPPPTADQAEELHQIIKAGWYLLELINEILDLSLIESGKIALSMESVSLSEIMHDCQTMIGAQAQQHGILISFSLCDNAWLVNADRTRVKQVLINLLSNAIKYNRAQGTVEVKCTGTPERIRISIKDSGTGLPPDKLAQ